MGGITERQRSGIQHPFSESRRALWAVERDAGSAEERTEGVDVKEVV